MYGQALIDSLVVLYSGGGLSYVQDVEIIALRSRVGR